MLKPFAALATLAFILFPSLLAAQARPAVRSGARLYTGGFFSAFQPDYGTNQLLGVGFFFDIDLGSHVGAEGEGRFLRFNQQFKVHEDNYLLGPRYRFHFNRFEPYVKFMLGNGQFNFPNNFAHGGYFMYAPGGGIDMPLGHRLRWRIVDYEYQRWTGFQGSSLTPHGFTTGLSYRIF